jgi:hypothetical protein
MFSLNFLFYSCLVSSFFVLLLCSPVFAATSARIKVFVDGNQIDDLNLSPGCGPKWFASLLQHGETRWKSSHITMLSASLSSSEPVQPVPAPNSSRDEMMCPELVPPVGQVVNRMGSDEVRNDVQFFSPMWVFSSLLNVTARRCARARYETVSLGRWYYPGKAATA